MSKNQNGAVVAGGCLALILWAGFYIGFVSLLVWILAHIVASVL